MGRVAVGTSGWSYDDWGGTFYPEGLARSRWFEHYATRFATVEVNYSFYRLPTERSVERWHDAAPEGFRFAVKGSRFITHVRRLSECREEIGRFLDRVGGLKAFLGPVLWQLPPTLERDVRLLGSFLEALPTGVRHAVEFRHPSWLTGEVAALLRRHGVAQVAVSSPVMPGDRTVTTDFVYVRFHGLGGGFAHDYSKEELRPWARFLREASDEGRDGYAYFNNDARARAPKNALDLVEMLGDAAVPWPR